MKKSLYWHKPLYITKETWEWLTYKEIDFILLLHKKRYSQKDIMRRLYLTDRTAYYKLRTRVAAKIKSDVEKINI